MPTPWPPELRSWLSNPDRPDLAYYLEHASLKPRPKPFQHLPAEVQALVFRLNRKVRPKPEQCYLNAYRAAVEEPAATYIEGVCVGPRNASPVPHAWVEVHGETVDLTLWGDPRREYPLPDYDYYGAAFPTEELIKTVIRNNRLEPMALVLARRVGAP